jgi:hypothetical protein
MAHLDVAAALRSALQGAHFGANTDRSKMQLQTSAVVS